MFTYEFYITVTTYASKSPTPTHNIWFLFNQPTVPELLQCRPVSLGTVAVGFFYKLNALLPPKSFTH